MESAQEGDDAAYRALLLDIHGDLSRFVRRRVQDSQEAEDIVQEVLLLIHRARHTFDPARRFEPWMYTIARNVSIDHERQRSTRRKREVLTAESPEIHASAAMCEAPLTAALERLPESQRRAFSMLKIEGLSVKKAAQRAGVTPGALRVRAHRAYRSVRAFIDGEDRTEGDG